MTQKKLEVGDVVMYVYEDSGTLSEGTLGIIEDAYDFGDGDMFYNVCLGDSRVTTGYPNTDKWEVIDHIDEEETPQFHAGDVVVYKGPLMVIYGELGIVRESHGPGNKVYVEFPDNFFFCSSENLEVIDHFDEEKTPQVRIGDVVVITEPNGLEDRYSWIGLVEYVKKYDNLRLSVCGVRVSNEWQGYIAEYPLESLEVIDYIDPDDSNEDDDDAWPEDEEQRPGDQADDSTPTAFKTGDYVRYIGVNNPHLCNKKGKVLEGKPSWYISILVDFEGYHKSIHPCNLIAWTSADEADYRNKKTPTSRFKVGDRIEYTGTETPEFIGRTGEVISAHPNWNNLHVVWDDTKVDATVSISNVTLIQECPKTPTSKFKVGDRIEYTGNQTPKFIGRTGTVKEVWPSDTLLVVWDRATADPKDTTVDPRNVILISRLLRETDAYIFDDVKMHFDGHSPLVCFDCSGSMDLDNLKEQWSQYEKAVLSYTHSGYVFGTSNPHSVYLNKLSLAYEWGQGQSTDLKPLLNYALHSFPALLIFSDGNMDLNELNKYPQLRTVIITPKNEVKFYRGKTLVGQGTITPPKTYTYNGIIEQKAEEALKEVQRQEDLNALGITEHPIRGTQRLLRLEHGSTVAKVICKSCNTVLKEIDLTK